MKRPVSPTRIALPFLAAAVLGSVQAQDAPPTTAPEPAAEESAPAAAEATIELKDPVAVVNGENISKAELETAFDQAVGNAGVEASTLSSEEKMAGYRKLLDDLILDKLIKAKATDIEVTDADVKAELDKIKASFPSPEVFEQQLTQSGQTEEKVLEMIKQGLPQRKWLEAQIGDGGKVSDEDAKKFYDENKTQFEQPETVRASHILFLVPEGATEEVLKEKEEAAKKAEERAKKGEDFAALAKELSEEPGAAERGGDLDFFTKDQMVPEFAEAAFSMDVDAISAPVKSQFGYHVIKVTDKKPAGTMDFEEVKPRLMEFLEGQKQQEAVTAVLDKLRAEAKIENNLPAATGPAPTGPVTN